MGNVYNDVPETNLVFNVDHIADVLLLQYNAHVITRDKILVFLQ